jgi:putative methyltransferase (TIGR04325 family)
LNILDFGGSLGSSYFQNIRFLNSIKKLNWCIVEQPAYVETGLLYFEDERLHFFKNINECYEKYNIDVVLLSSVLQYLEYPYNYLNELVEKKPKYIIIDRTPFVKKPDRITIQKVNPRFYKASYPCWFFNIDKFRNFMSINYDLIFEFDALDKAYIKSEFKGFLYKLKTINV